MAKRIGDILVERGFVSAKVLERALVKQAGPGQRLCSFLVASDALTPDDAARALAEQHGVPAVLQKHLDHRVKALTELIPASIARAQCVLPIARMAAGELIVCVRDPKPELRQLLAAVTKERIVLAVGLASRLELLVAQTYGEDETDEEFEVDLTTGPVMTIDPIVDVDLEMIDELPDLVEDLDEPAPAPEPLAALGPLTLVELDDRSVSRDLSQSGAIQIGPLVREKLPTLPPAEARTSPTLPPANAARPQSSSLPPAIGRATTPPAIGRTTTSPAIGRTTTVRTSLMAVAHPKPAAPPPPSDAIAAGTVLPSRAAASVAGPAEAGRAVAPRRSIDAIVAKAMQVASARWQAVLLLAIEDRLALGHRGHGRQLGDDAVRGVAIPLTAPSIVKAAYDAGALVTTVPAGTGAVQDRLERLLAMPRFPAAMPITTDGAIAFVLVVGDPVPGVPDATPEELARLGTEFAAALARLAVT